ncbi:MAG: type 4a pilus biogenesis protein PilO [Candidatus Binatia bacterium]
MREFIDQMLLLPGPKKIGLLAGLILIIIALDYTFLYSPRSIRISDLQEQIQNAQVERDIKRSLVANLPKLKEELQNLHGMLKEAVAQLPDRKEIPDLLSSISGKAREAGLEILIFRPRAETVRDFYAEIPVDIVVLGRFGDVVSFFDEIGKLNRLVNIQNIEIKRPKVNDGRVLVQTSAQATTFRFLDEAERAKIAAEKAAKEKAGRR